MAHDWEQLLRDTGVLWKHDGNLKRPFVRLTSGDISDQFADTSFAVAKPYLVGLAAEELAFKLEQEYEIDPRDLVICGQQKGSTTLGSHVAEILGSGYVFTNKIGEGIEKQMVVDERFVGIHSEESIVILVEDVSTTALTSSLSRIALQSFGFKTVSDVLLTLVDRTNGSNQFGFEIISCYKANKMRTWKEGCNPFTPDGREVIPPVRAKTKEGRRAMHQVFD